MSNHSLITLFFVSTTLGPDLESYLSSELLSTPLHSPSASKSVSPIRPFKLPVEDQDEEQHLATVTGEHHGTTVIPFSLPLLSFKGANIFCEKFLTENNFLEAATVHNTTSNFHLVRRTGGFK